MSEVLISLTMSHLKTFYHSMLTCLSYFEVGVVFLLLNLIQNFGCALSLDTIHDMLICYDGFSSQYRINVGGGISRRSQPSNGTEQRCSDSTISLGQPLLRPLTEACYFSTDWTVENLFHFGLEQIEPYVIWRNLMHGRYLWASISIIFLARVLGIAEWLQK